MAYINLNGVALATESGGTVVLDSAVTGIPAAGVTGVLPVGVTGGSGLTALGTVTTGNLSNTAIVYPAGHIIRTYHHQDDNNGSYTSEENPLGGASGLRTPASGTNITTSVANSQFMLIAQVSSSWGGSYSASYGVSASDYGLYLYRNNVSGTSSTRFGGTSNTTARGSGNTWYGTDDQIKGYNPLDVRVFVMTGLDTPNCAAGSTLYYSVGVAGTMSPGFPYNRVGHGTGNGVSASTLIVYEIAP